MNVSLDGNNGCDDEKDDLVDDDADPFIFFVFFNFLKLKSKEKLDGRKKIDGTRVLKRGRLEF